jgi:hypothetical protein
MLCAAAAALLHPAQPAALLHPADTAAASAEPAELL